MKKYIDNRAVKVLTVVSPPKPLLRLEFQRKESSPFSVVFQYLFVGVKWYNDLRILITN